MWPYLLWFQIESQTSNEPATILPDESPSVTARSVVYTYGTGGECSGGIALHNQFHIGVRHRAGSGGKDLVDVPLSYSTYPRPDAIIIWIVGRMVGIPHDAFWIPDLHQAIDVLRDDTFSFRIQKLHNGFFVASRRWGIGSPGSR